ncbi:MAG: carboxypeptidase regulatory-like domain-containing protein [Pyrinomonadaceae bacterium]
MGKYASRRSIAVVLLLLFASLAAHAQEFRGSVMGHITDPGGAAIPGAAVTIKNVGTNVESTATTNDEGAYEFPLLQPGKYTLTVKSQGFSAAVREGVEVRVADKLTIDVPLAVGAISDTVTTVASVTPALETGSVTTGSTITGRQISELPLTEGTAYQLATLAPGISYTGNPLFTGPTSNGNLAAFRSNGASGSNQITLDGSPNYAFDGGVGFSPPSDAVQEFKVQTNTFDAQQGYSAGATVNVAVKSGTNDPHGSLYWFNRDRSRTANNFFSNRSGQSRPIRTYNRYGGVLSGPVYLPKIYNGHDKTFFLVSYEHLLDNVAEPQLFTVPTAAMRNGDFSALIVNRANIADAANTVLFNPFDIASVASNGTVTRRSFGCPTTGAVSATSTCNMIPANLLSPIAKALINFYPLPNVAGTANGTQNNFFSNQIRHENYRAWLTRLDHRISESQSIFGKYYHSFNPEDRNDPFGIVNGFPVTQGFENRTNDGGNIDYTNTLSSTTVLDLRVSLNRFQQQRMPAQNFDLSTLGFSQQALTEFRGYQYFPGILIRNLDATRPIHSNIGATRSDFNSGRLRPFYMGSVQPSVTKLFGDHTMRVGYDLRVLRENFISNGFQAGRYFFDGTFTSPASNSNTATRNAFGRDIAAFLLGVPSPGSGSTASQIDNPINYSVQSVYHGFFVQDDWRATSKLTLNLGLRYELEGGLTERYNRIQRGFDLSTPSPIDAAARAAYTTAYNAAPSNFVLTPDQFRVLGGYSFADDSNRTAWNTDKNNWQPRVGAAYTLDEKTVLRAGFGMFMAPHQIEIQGNPLQTGFAGTTPFIASNDNGRTFVGTLANPFPNGLIPSPGASQGLLSSTGIDVGSSTAPVFPLDRKNAMFSRLIFGVQRELPGHFVVEANYVTAWGRDLAVARNLDFTPRSFLGTDPTTDAAANTLLVTGTIPNPFRNLLPNTGSPLNTATTITRAQSLLQFPQFTNLWVEQYNGSNRYNALQLQVNQRFSRDLTLTASYTRSRLREKIDYLNPSDTELEDRISTDDRPNRVTFSAVYELPLGRGKALGKDMNRLVDLAFGGWQVNGTYEWQTGEPFLLSPTQVWYYGGDVNQIVSRVGENTGTGQKYGIDVSAFTVPPVNGAGVVRLNSFNTGLRNVPTTLDSARNQPFLNVNLSLSKNFHIREGMRLQVRAEALNAFNHAYFGNGIGLDPSNAGTFGIVTTQRNNPRDIQLGAKFIF